jgi:hypothetical protein
MRRQQQDGRMLAERVAPFVRRHERAGSIELRPTPRTFGADYKTPASCEQGQTLAVTLQEGSALLGRQAHASPARPMRVPGFSRLGFVGIAWRR